MSDSNTIDTLNTLIETCKDGEYGFRTSAEHVKSADVKSIFPEPQPGLLAQRQ